LQLNATIENRLSVLEVEMKGMRKSLDSLAQLLKANAQSSKSEGMHASKR